ncbi:3' terminal RNA ribose 2'-O-methyltransferase Hen1 [Nakamurella flava]|uniref:Small RNA 2'-O-methyltransferase n=1 Tax=Nakamurella flava TaxID=2576308 RepID=A0A4U6QAL9_9ACTN|nr:3' terminal RNA ribose 2'-O-methyltransferase Hen1 [Nakamurella flava]TKV56971.1 3' terminal RNA ribose 2'-O-methyltransferase Hen1 [Nakamurella flava]
MLLTITTTHRPATDLGFLLHKHPGRVQSFPQSSGTAHVFYPQADEVRCTAALLLEVDPIALVRGRREGDTGFPLGRYVNDRPYVASSLLAVALQSVFGTAAAGVCKLRPELAATPLPLEIGVPALPGDVDLVGRLFTPLGWSVEATAPPLDPDVPDWGAAPVVSVRLSGTLRLADALRQLYVLLPVLDGGQHYWVDEAEVDKLVRAGSGWLTDHPERDFITRRYLAGQRDLTRDARERLDGAHRVAAGAPSVVGADLSYPHVPKGADDAGMTSRPAEADSVAAKGRLREQRHAAVLDAVRAARPRVVGDLGCGSGALVADLAALPGVERVVATDVSAGALAAAARRLHLDDDAVTDRLDRFDADGVDRPGHGDPPPGREHRIRLFQSALTYRDPRLTGLDVAVLMEVVEHVDLDRLPALERAVFADAAPSTVVVTTPNVEYNVHYPALVAGGRRHPDHRFEWTRAEFTAWSDRVAAVHGYTVTRRPVGPVDELVGAPTQLAVFTREVSR